MAVTSLLEEEEEDNNDDKSHPSPSHRVGLGVSASATNVGGLVGCASPLQEPESLRERGEREKGERRRGGGTREQKGKESESERDRGGRGMCNATAVMVLWLYCYSYQSVARHSSLAILAHRGCKYPRAGFHLHEMMYVRVHTRHPST